MIQRPRTILFFLTIILLTTLTAHAANKTRKSVFSLTPQEIQAYRNVVDSMKALPLNDPRNWEYQSGMHRHITPEQVTNLPDDGRFSDKEELSKYALEEPPHAVSNETWDQCHQTNPDRLFLLWHRVYVSYFEKIAQKISNQPDFRLPYWDYTKGDTISRTLPTIFREDTYIPEGESTPVANPLKVVRRESINAGSPLDQSIVSLNAMKEDTYESFSQNLEGTPHNAIHGALGKNNTLLMGATIWAAQDPIFWLHHSNIDRLWSCWEKNDHISTELLDDGKQYPFIDENGTVVKHTVSEMNDLIATLDYKYESMGDCLITRAPTPVPFSVLVKKTVNAFKSTAPLMLSSSPTTIDVPLGEAATKALANTSFLAFEAPSSAILTLKDISISAPLGMVYKVILRPKGGTSPGKTIGVIGFFGKGEKLFSGEDMSSHSLHSMESFTLKFSVGAELMAIAAAHADGNSELVFIPSTGVEGDQNINEQFIKEAQPKIGDVTLDLQVPTGIITQ